MDEMSIEELAERLQEHRPEDVAAETGLGYHTVVRYRTGKVRRGGLDTFRLLAAYVHAHAEAANTGGK